MCPIRQTRPVEPHDHLEVTSAARAETSDPNSTRPVRRRVVVFGRVHGVFFRDTCRRVAQRLGLHGLFRNRSDGTVEAVFEGDAADVEEALTWCRHGPPSASVSGVEVTDEPVAGEGPFRIVH